MKIFGLREIQFQGFFRQIQNYLTRALGQSNINKSSIFGQFMTVISSISHNIMLYIEDALTEQNKYTAQRKKSIFGLAAQSGYQPSYGKASGVWLRISHKANNESGLGVIIQDRQTLLCTQNGLYYSLILDTSAIVVRPDVERSNQYAYAVQGKFEQQRFISPGGMLYGVNFKFVGYLDPDYVEVYINDEKWTKYPSLYDIPAMGHGWYLQYNPVNGCDVMFGNDVHGQALQNGDVIVIKYLTHDGSAGNLDTSRNTQFLFSNSLRNINGESVEGNNILSVRFATRESVAAGSDSESIDQVRRMIGYQSRALVLADPNNYKAFISKYSFCGYNRTWSEPGSLVINSLIMRNYSALMSDGSDYFNLKETDFYLTDAQKSSIINAMVDSGMMMAGSTYNILDMTLVKYALFIYVKLKNASTDKEIVSTNIKKLVGGFFGDIQSDQYIPKSDIINLIKENVKEVDGVNCYFLSQRNEEAQQQRGYTRTTYTYNQTTGTYDKKEENVRLYFVTNDDGTMAIENPMLGLDAHGNIVVESDREFPVLMGGWQWVNKQNQEVYAQPITITFED